MSKPKRTREEKTEVGQRKKEEGKREGRAGEGREEMGREAGRERRGGRFMQQRKAKGVDHSRQRADIQVSPASSTSHWGMKQNGANQANFQRPLTIVINSERMFHGPPLGPRTPVWLPHNSQMPKRTKETQNEDTLNHPNYGESNRFLILCRDSDPHPNSTLSTDYVKRT